MADDVSRDIPQLMARAENSLSAARLLIDNGYFTEAVSRAIYAATALLHSEGITVSNHAAVIVQVGQHFAKTGRLESRLHRLLIDMFDERQLANTVVPDSLLSERRLHTRTRPRLWRQ